MTKAAAADLPPPAATGDYQLHVDAAPSSSSPPPAAATAAATSSPPPSLPRLELPAPVGVASAARGLVAQPPRFVLVQATLGAAPREPPPPPAYFNEPRLVVVLSRAQLEAVEHLRWAAFFVFVLYVLTFFAWPSVGVSAAGLATGLVGYAACRLAQQGARRLWLVVVLFFAANCVMLLLLVFVFASLFVHDLRRRTAASSGQPAMLLLAVFTALGLMLHVRAQRIARDFLRAFRGGVTRVPRRASLAVVRPSRRAFFVHDTSLLAPVGARAQTA